jgi:hypothetical protein
MKHKKNNIFTGCGLGQEPRGDSRLAQLEKVMPIIFYRNISFDSFYTIQVIHCRLYNIGKIHTKEGLILGIETYYV